MERAEPELELERTARRARRALWAFRLIFYGGAAIAAIVLLTGRDPGHFGTWLDGRTDQDRTFTMRLDDTVTGTMSLVERNTHPRATAPYVCESGPVALSAPAG